MHSFATSKNIQWPRVASFNLWSTIQGRQALEIPDMPPPLDPKPALNTRGEVSNQTVNDGVAHSKNPRKCAYHVTFDLDDDDDERICFNVA